MFNVVFNVVFNVAFNVVFNVVFKVAPYGYRMCQGYERLSHDSDSTNRLLSTTTMDPARRLGADDTSLPQPRSLSRPTYERHCFARFVCYEIIMCTSDQNFSEKGNERVGTGSAFSTDGIPTLMLCLTLY